MASFDWHHHWQDRRQIPSEVEMGAQVKDLRQFLESDHGMPPNLATWLAMTAVFRYYNLGCTPIRPG